MVDGLLIIYAGGKWELKRIEGDGELSRLSQRHRWIEVELPVVRLRKINETGPEF